MKQYLEWLGVAAVAAVVSIVFLFAGGVKSGGTTQTNLATNAPANASSFVGANGVESDAGFFDAAGGASKLLGSLGFGSNTTTTGFTYLGTASTCATGTSTPFSIKNPFTATSTALVFMTGTGNATSTNLLVGTSTKATGLVSTDVSATLANATIGTSSPQFTLFSGSTVLGSGQISAGSGTSERVVVAPSEYVSAYATSTYGTTGAVGYSPAITCTYKILWNN